ncbi:MAG: BACON domain-containing carbohydrate-binding protein, partial [Bryobacteraceae bacterium]
MRYAWLLLLPSLLAAQSGTFSLGSGTIVVGPAASNGSVQLVASSSTATWTAASNASWLQLAAGSMSGTGSALIQFSYGVNPNTAAQSGTLTIAGLTFTVTQAGSSFVPVSELSTLISEGLNLPYGVALDSSGNVYIADTGNNAIEEWSATQGMTTLVPAAAGLNGPHGVAVDGQGNVYIADAYNNAIKEWSPANQQLTTLVPSTAGLNFPLGVAVDGQDNVYIADFGNNAVKQWNPTTQSLITLGPSNPTGLDNPTGVAVDGLGNVYIADFRDNAIKEWNATTQQIVTLVPQSQGLSFPNAVAVDGRGNVYLVDGNNNALKEWNGQTLITLASSGVNGSFGVATDGQGNFYIANTGTSTLLKFTSGYFGFGVTNLNEGPQAGTDAVPVQMLAAGIPPPASSDQPWLTITGSTGGAIGFSFQANTSVASRIAHITVLNQQVTVTQSGDVAAGITKSAGDNQAVLAGQVFPVALQVNVTDAGGSPVQGASVTFSVTPGASGASGTFNLIPPITASTDQNGNAMAPALTAGSTAGQFTVTASVNSLSVTFTLNILTSITFTLGSGSTLVGNAAGTGTVLLIGTGSWTAASNASWLQLAAGSTSGAGSAVIQFNYNANSNSAPQTGTLTIAGLLFSVTQAGAGYALASPVTALVSSGLNNPQGVAVDGQGNVYIADTANNVVKEWSPTTQQTVVLCSGFNNPKAVAVDRYGNLYIADSGNNAVEEWSAANLTTLASGLSNPSGVAVDGRGNVYFSDTGHNAVDEWNAASQQVTQLVNTGLSGPTGVAVDALGNVYFADSGHNAVKEWVAASGQVTALVSSGLLNPTGLAVDGQGNAYISDTGDNAVKEWSAGSQQVAALVSSGLNGPAGTAVDTVGNVYIADANNNAVKKLTIAYVGLSYAGRTEGAAAGTDSVTAQVLPAGTPLTATSDQSWLTITGVAGGSISFSFQANFSAVSRIAHITVLGAQVTVTQSADIPANLTAYAGNGQSTPPGQPLAAPLEVFVTDGSGYPIQGAPVTFTVTPGSSGASGTFPGPSSTATTITNASGLATAPALTANTIAGTFTVTASVGTLSITFTVTNASYALAASSVLVGNTAGNGSVFLVAGGPWNASSNASWLHLSAGSTSGNGSTPIQFSYGANPNSGMQTGTLTIQGLTFTVTQTGTSFAPFSVLSTLVSSGLKTPGGVAVDGNGNVYIADSGDNAVKEWNTTLTALVSSGLSNPQGVAVDGKGNIYIADSTDNAIKEWNAVTNAVTSLVGSGISYPAGVAVDAQGNVYFSDYGHNAIKEWIAASGLVNTLVSTGLNAPRGVAVDALGNVYFADSKNNAIKKWIAGSSPQVVTLVNSGLNTPSGVAVDGDGNVYIADTSNNAIKEWNPLNSVVTTLVSSGPKGPAGVAVDGQGNVYIASTNANSILKFTPAYVSPGFTTKTEVAASGTDSLPVTVIPAGTPITATSNQTWLVITSVTGGAVSFTFSANTSTAS